jgi:hypothetical protein
MLLSGEIPLAVDLMDNEFNTVFGAWPEVHLVISAEGTLILKTEGEAGLGSIKGGPWQDQVATCLAHLATIPSI